VGVVAGTVVLKSAGTGAEVTIPAGSGAAASPGQDPTAPRAWRKAEFNALSVRTDFPQAAAPQPSPRRSTPRSSEPAEPDAPSAYPPEGYHPPYGGNSPPSGGYGGRPGGGYQSPSGTGGRPY
jgi:hypothetical protein